MRLRRQSFGAAAVAAAALVGIAVIGSARPAREHGLASDEVARIRAHLARVERELRARDVSHLTPEQRRARARHVAELRRYREGGVFPRNHDFPGRRVPYFVDRHGTLCAMAHLIAASGRHDIVARVAAARNNALVPELADDPALVAWLDSAGLSLGEAARIQPTYDYDAPADPPTVGIGYAVASGVASAVSGAAIVLNLQRDTSAARREWRGALGVASGLFGLVLAADTPSDGGSGERLRAWNAAAGLASLGLGVRTLVRPPTRRAPAPPVTAERAAPDVSLSIVPVVGPADAGARVALRARF